MRFSSCLGWMYKIMYKVVIYLPFGFNGSSDIHKLANNSSDECMYIVECW